LFSSGDAKITDPTYQSAVTVALSQVADPAVRQVTTYYTSDEQSLVSKDQKSTYAVITLAGTEQEQQNAVERLRLQFRSDTFQIQLGGPAAVAEEIKHQVESDLAKIETFSFPILALLLLAVFRGFVAASLPLLLGGFSILGAFVITRLLTGVMEVSQYAINIITVLGLGLAVDYSLFMVSRFREELRERLGKVEEGAALLTLSWLSFVACAVESAPIDLATAITSPLPDVVVTSLSYANGVFTSTLKNQGTGPTPSGISIGVGYSVDGVFRTWGAANGPLAAGASATIGTHGGAYGIPNGTHQIAAHVDDVNRFAESNEANNQLSKSIAVGAG
ncbi:MAG: MMPL family transporter, partial [Gammaproteobacteria bacterium]